MVIQEQDCDVVILCDGQQQHLQALLVPAERREGTNSSKAAFDIHPQTTYGLVEQDFVRCNAHTTEQCLNKLFKRAPLICIQHVVDGPWAIKVTVPSRSPQTFL